MKVMFDTCIYIDFVKKSKNESLFYDRTMFRFLSPVVVMELRAGAKSSADVRALEKLFFPYSEARRVVSLNANVFLKAGEIIQKVHHRYGNLTPGFSNDVLVALSAVSIGATLFTSNKRDFEKISEFLHVRLHSV